MRGYNNWNARDCNESVKPLARHTSECNERQKFSTNIKIQEFIYGKPSRRMIGEDVNIDNM